MSTPDDWNEAMEWWKSQSDCVQGLIRKVATEKVHSFQGDGYGISSSDINHTVYGMYSDFKFFKKYCEENGLPVSVVDFCVDEMNEIS